MSGEELDMATLGERIAHLDGVIKTAGWAVSMMMALLALLVTVLIFMMDDTRDQVAALDARLRSIESEQAALPDRINDRLTNLANSLTEAYQAGQQDRRSAPNQ